jgi:MSHA biogenesis protein MshJ
MHPKIQALATKFEALSLREKVLVLASMATAVIIGWYLLLSEPLYLKTKQDQQQAETLDKAVTELNKQLQNLQRRLHEDPHRELKQRIAQLDEQIQRLDVELRDKFHGLIEPRQMASVLESVLQQHKDLVLVRVQSLEAVPLITQGEDSAKAEAAPQVEVYRHGMQVEFEGSYLATLDYLKTLEALPWEFYWDSVELDVKAYPRARIVITVHTLSLRDAWIGV